ncbi:MAG: hypothetical protein ABEJ79_02495 [Halolamina sp.]
MVGSLSLSLVRLVQLTVGVHLVLAGLVAVDATRRGCAVGRWTVVVAVTGLPGAVAYYHRGRTG